MNNLGECSPYGFCYFHPREVVVGVCAACLTEKLLVLASKQGHGGTAAALQVKKDAHQQYGSSSTRAFTRVPSRKPSSISIPKVFALGSSLLHRLDSRHRRPGYDSDDGASVLSLDVPVSPEPHQTRSYRSSSRTTASSRGTRRPPTITPSPAPPKPPAPLPARAGRPRRQAAAWWSTPGHAAAAVASGGASGSATSSNSCGGGGRRAIRGPVPASPARSTGGAG